MTLKLITAPTSEPVSIDEAKRWLRLDSDDEIDIVGTLVKAARQLLDGADGYLGRCLGTQDWAMTLDRFPWCEREIRIPLPPLQSIVSVSYLDTSGAAQIFADSNYRLDADDWSGRMLLANGAAWPSTLCERAAVTVTFRAGYSAGVPEALRAEVLQLVGIWFDDRSQVGQLPDGWSSQYRIVPVA